MSIQIAVSFGELIDKITILEIKTQKISDPLKQKNISRELVLLKTTLPSNVFYNEELRKLRENLKTVNEILWQIEDDIRDCERQKDFTEKFIELARAVYINNDLRAALKRQIDEMLGSDIKEEKSYRAYY